MLVFGIPLRSERASNNWRMVTALFNHTLTSVYNQTDPDFRIIVACHEKPRLERHYDDRVEFLQVDIPTPKTAYEMMVDKGYKTHTIAMRLREIGGGFYMQVDADDIQSSRLAEYVNAHPDANGFLSRNGYYYHVGDNFIKKGHKFPNGSSTIVKYTVEDLPDKYYASMEPSQNSNPHIIRKRHGDIPSICAKLGRPLSILPFIASIYMRDTGDNHSLMGKGESKFRILEQLVMPKIYLDEKLKKEFSLNWI